MIRGLAILLCALPVLASSLSPSPSPSPDAPLILDDGTDPSLWSVHPADGVTMTLAADAGEHDAAIRADFAFTGGGWAILRHDVGVDLPENYALRFRLRGVGPRNHLEFKFLDATGENVWWFVKRDVDFDGEWTTYTVKKRHVSFAWGPDPGSLERIEALEIAVTAGEGGVGSLWVDGIVLQPLPPPSAAAPAPLADATSGDAAAAVDGRGESAWRSEASDAAPTLTLDLGGLREFGGLVLTWAEGEVVPDYEVDLSSDGVVWTTAWRAAGSDGGRDPVPLPEAEAAYVRLRCRGAAALADVEIRDLAWSASREAVARAEAALIRRGLYPRGILGEQAYWTVLGPDASPWDPLLGEDGALEPRAGGPSLEPVLMRDGRLVTWADVTVDHDLVDHTLPIPTATWRGEGFRLRIAPVAIRQDGWDRLSVRYTYADSGAMARTDTLALVVRPFQVNPPSQTLGRPGGTARIEDAAVRGRAIELEGRPWALADREPAAAAAATFTGGDPVADHLARGGLPGATVVRDPYGAASGVQLFPLTVAPGGEAVLDVVLALDPDDDLSGARAAIDGARAAAVADWRTRLGGFTLDIPAAPEVANTVLAQRGYILVNRCGPGIRPGSRSYARSWIRDGALTSWALLRTGLTAPARAFLEWYAPYQFDNGKIPCVVDERGADPVPEHDSSGEFCFLVQQVVRHTGDLDLAAEMWPRVDAAAAYLNRLRAERLTPEYEGTEFWGLLPPSISHEGYSAKPMHSYWDDAFCYRGLSDAARLAQRLGREADARRYRQDAADFGRDLGASVARTMAVHDIDYVPGCADLGDLDPTSTTVLLVPGEAGDLLPDGAVARTFDRYWTFFTGRASGEDPWDAYTPYEVRNIGAAVRLGERDRAVAMVTWFLGDRRPAGWRHWAEVVSSRARTPRFLGDMPHTWVGSDFIRSVLDMIAFEDASLGEIIVGAGLPADWLVGAGVTMTGLRAGRGRLDVMIREEGDGWRVRLDGDAAPASGFVVRLPGAPDLRANALPVDLHVDR